MSATDPNAAWIDGHIWQYTEEQMRAVLKAAGFTIERFEHSQGVTGPHSNIWAKKPVGAG